MCHRLINIPMGKEIFSSFTYLCVLTVTCMHGSMSVNRGVNRIGYHELIMCSVYLLRLSLSVSISIIIIIVVVIVFIVIAIMTVRASHA